MSIEIILGGLANQTSSNLASNSHCLLPSYNINIVPVTKTYYVTTIKPSDVRCFDFEGIVLNPSQSDALVKVIYQFKESISNFKTCVSDQTGSYYYEFSKCFISEVLSFELNFLKCFENANDVFEDHVFECLDTYILREHIIINLEEI